MLRLLKLEGAKCLKSIVDEYNMTKIINKDAKYQDS